MCNCAELEEIVSCGDNEQEEFIRPMGLRLLKERPEARLYACPECNTYWHVDHMQRGPQAIKVKEPFTWENFDDLPYRRKSTERFHGGCSEEQCQWAGCTHQALKGLALCVYHAYPQLSQRAL
jgi:hypothetical protein